MLQTTVTEGDEKKTTQVPLLGKNTRRGRLTLILKGSRIGKVGSMSASEDMCGGGGWENHRDF